MAIDPKKCQKCGAEVSPEMSEQVGKATLREVRAIADKHEFGDDWWTTEGLIRWLTDVAETQDNDFSNAIKKSGLGYCLSCYESDAGDGRLETAILNIAKGHHPALFHFHKMGRGVIA